MERIDKLYQMGVRLITLTWNDDNCFGHPHAKEAERMQLGLTPFGRKAVTYMASLESLWMCPICPMVVFMCGRTCEGPVCGITLKLQGSLLRNEKSDG